jgi:predicted nucleotidyltransferase
MKRPNITEAIKKGLEALHLDIEVWLYGSEARGDARPDSDIDLLILVDQPTVTDRDEDRIFEPLYQIELQTGVLINPIIMPKQEWGRRVSPFYLNVENEGVRL